MRLVRSLKTVSFGISSWLSDTCFGSKRQVFLVFYRKRFYMFRDLQRNKYKAKRHLHFLTVLLFCQNLSVIYDLVLPRTLNHKGDCFLHKI